MGAAPGGPVAPKCRSVIFSWLAKSISPAFRRSPAVSSSASASGLIVFFFAIVHLLNDTVHERLRQRAVISFEPHSRDFLRRCQFVVLDIGARILGEAKQENRTGL